MSTRTNIIDKIFIIMLTSVFFVNGVTKTLNFDQTIDWVKSFNFPSEIVYVGILIELVAPLMILINFIGK